MRNRNQDQKTFQNQSRDFDRYPSDVRTRPTYDPHDYAPERDRYDVQPERWSENPSFDTYDTRRDFSGGREYRPGESWERRNRQRDANDYRANAASEPWWDRATDWVERKVESHVGKGPKGYRRSEERIKEDVCEQLTKNPLLDASTIEVQVKGAEVILTGTVNDRQFKRIAEDLAAGVWGVRDVINQIRLQGSEVEVDEGLARSGSLSPNPRTSVEGRMEGRASAESRASESRTETRGSLSQNRGRAHA